MNNPYWVVNNIDDEKLLFLLIIGFWYFCTQKVEKYKNTVLDIKLLYVAITRARQLVYMVGYGEPCGLVESIIES